MGGYSKGGYIRVMKGIRRDYRDFNRTGAEGGAVYA